MASLYPSLDPSMIPAGVPPPGVVPNFVNPPTRAELPKIFIYVTLPPMLVFLGLRIYTRVKYTVLGLDDVIGNPSGPHMWDIPLSKVTTHWAEFSIVLAIMYLVAALFIKASILVLYRRIFRPSDMANLLIWICVVVNVAFYLISITIFAVACVPHGNDYKTGGWLSAIYSQRCNSISGRVTIASGAVGTFIDLYILIIPAIFLSGLQTSIKRKAGLLAISAVGTAALAFSIAGTYFRSINIRTAGSDLSWDSMPIYGTNVGEINVGIMSSCMPVIFVLFRGLTAWCASQVSKLWSLAGLSKRTNGPIEPVDTQPLHDDMSDKKKLPEWPKGTLTGLRSLMRNFNRTNPAKTQTANSCVTYDSVDYDYHMQLKKQAEPSQSPQGTGS
ncbi:hypothetical protein F5B22DRAFT_652278 [Xylaria bambusicola]|uniref:uncharacterized protein n=1 Tax=Xylaria bambusicola TaxID=326684 RepID=UPI002008323E|nr:uncharacterized protein F5B22DRAFT_652278 [Xylaria bambusicola]KAI0503201.1 hypothetical protein F5B22DRAFT_652278 [Xylaria bambusicola]